MLARAAPARTVGRKTSASPKDLAWARDAIIRLEAQYGGRLGVVAHANGSSERIAYRARERFAMCSTHKFLTVAATLAMVDEGRIELTKRIRYGSADLLGYAPVTRRNVGAGAMTAEALCAAVLEWSDNTAENLLLGLLGGPTGWTRYARSIGDRVSRLDRIEPALNSAIPNDPRDTTTPDAMARDLDVVLFGAALSDASRARLENWMLEAKTGNRLLRAGLPKSWRTADKSGAGGNGTVNDIGVIVPEGAAPIIASVYYTESKEILSSRERVVAAVGRVIATAFST